MEMVRQIDIKVKADKQYGIKLFSQKIEVAGNLNRMFSFCQEEFACWLFLVFASWGVFQGPSEWLIQNGFKIVFEGVI